MQSKAPTVAAYLAELPPDRRAAIESVRKVILDNLDPGFQEHMGYGMLGYSVPHSIYPPGYHCDPKQPLPFAGLASQKQHMSLYMMGLYYESDYTLWFHQAWEKTGKKLDMGKSCIRFKRLEDLPLDVIAEAFRRVTPKLYIAMYEAALASQAQRKATGKAGGPNRKKAAKKAAGKKKAPARAKTAKTAMKTTPARKTR